MRGTHLALSDWRPGVSPQLYRRPALAETVGGLTAVVGEVLLAHTGHSQRVSLAVPVMGDQVTPPML